MLSTLDVSPAKLKPNSIVTTQVYDLTEEYSGGDDVKPFLLNRQTKDRFGAPRFGLSFSNLGKDSQLNLRTLCTIASARRDEDLRDDGVADFALTDHAQLLGWVVQTLFQSETAQDMLEEAANNSWSIELDDLDHHDFHLDVPEKHIVLNTHGLGAASLSRSEYFRNLLLVSLTRALRDVWQETRYGGFEDRYGPESILMLERVRAADCDIMTVLVAWELRQADLSDLWRHTLGSDEGDLAMTFSSTLERNTVSPSIHDAMHAAFRQWFASSERINICDHETLEYLDNFIAQEGSESFGGNHMKARALEIISCLPNKTAYLKGYGDELIFDPLYSGMNDPINQSHFMHIMHDMQAINVAGIPFRSEALASKIFPEGFGSETVDA